MQKSVNDRVAGWWAPLFGAIAAFVYLLTLTMGAYPGDSATLIVNGSGLAPSPSMANPLWMIIAKIISGIPIGELSVRLNVFSVLCGAVAVGLLFSVASRLMHLVVDAEVTDDRLGRLLSWMAGAGSSLFLAFCTPFWSVSNRAHTASFDVMLLLTVTHLCLRYERTLALSDLCLCLFLYAVGMAEFSTFIVFAPLFALFVLFQLWVHSEIRATTVAAALGSFVAGLMMYVIAAWRFLGSELHQLQWPVTGFWEVLLHFWRSQHSLILHSLPSEGWLLIVIVTIIPWLTMLLVAKRSLNESSDLGQIALHLVMTVIVFLVMFSAHFAPLAKLGVGRLLVTPYVLSAMVFGYLAAYWCMMFVMLASGPRWGSAGRARMAESICIVVFVGAALTAAVLNASKASGKSANIMSAYARDVINQLGDRSWLITNGELDSTIRVVAHEEGRTIKIINLGLAGNELFLRYMASLFENPRVKSFADVGLIPMLTEWFKIESRAADQVAITVEADVWGLAERRGIPKGPLYDGAASIENLNAAELMEENRAFWDRTVPGMTSVGTGNSSLAPLAELLLRELSRKANNLGVLMEDLGRKDEAFEAYTKADEIVPNNISALLNRHAMIVAGYKTSHATSITQAVQTVMATEGLDRSLANVVQMYGSLRSPASAASMGWKWSRMGFSSLAVAGVKQAIAATDGSQLELQNMLAGLYLTQARADESEAVYLEMLTHHPEDGTPYLGLARVAASRGDRKRAIEMLKRAEKTGVPATKILPEHASILIAEGDVDAASQMLDHLLSIDTNSVRALTLQAAILIRKGEIEEVKKSHLPRLTALNQSFAVGILATEVAMKEGDIVRARTEMERTHALVPNHLPVLEALVNLDFTEGRKDIAAEHVKKLLSLAPDHPMGNYVLAKLQMERREYALAENSLRRALVGRRAVAVLNDLAYVLSLRKAYKEAEELVREAIAINPKMYQFHDTLGMILTENGRFQDAQQALDQALALAPDNPGVLMHIIELDLAQEKRSDASEVLAVLKEKRSQLSYDEQNKLDQLAKDLE